ncbi:MAG: DUF1552 domain-containing protein [Lentisphaeraceae bacterium]|nr:DUF1552 domain-containing protein [Lentisphaeraceae bacterium]
MNRRTILKAAGLSLLLPQLESFGEIKENKIHRMLCLSFHLGLYTPELYPVKAGKDFETTELLKPFEGNKYSVFSGLDNPQVGGGHNGAVGVLTGFYDGSGKNKISVDQAGADINGQTTRFSSLSFRGSSNFNNAQISWNKFGQPVAQEYRTDKIFNKLFGVRKDSKEQREILIKKKSILDAIYGQAKGMNKNLLAKDKNKIDEYFTSIREVEKQLKRREYWLDKPVKKVKSPLSKNKSKGVIEYVNEIFKLIALAYRTDSTRFITMQIPGSGNVPIENNKTNYHGLSHHGKAPQKVKDLVTTEKAFLTHINNLVNDIKEDGQLDQTQVLVTGALGNASSHSTKNLPVILLGGGFKHGQHYDHREIKKPLCNLYLSMLQKMGYERDSFSDSTGTLEVI